MSESTVRFRDIQPRTLDECARQIAGEVLTDHPTYLRVETVGDTWLIPHNNVISICTGNTE